MTGKTNVHARVWQSSAIARRALIAGLVGFLLCIVGVVIEPQRTFAAYLFAYVTVLTVVVGALIQAMTSHVTAARWFTVLRKLTLSVSASLPMLAVLVIPVLLGTRFIYPWAHPASLPAAMQKLVEHRHAWLNTPFFDIRAVIYVIIFTAFGEVMRRWSAREGVASDSADTVRLLHNQRRTSAIGLIATGLTITLVAFDWLMPLDTQWYSTVYGAYVFAGGFIAALGLIALIAYLSIRNDGALAGTVTDEHFGALGKLMLTFVVFWVYIALSQFLIIWIGDIPADASWYVTRGSGSWAVLAIMVVAGQFAIPFLLLLSRTLKRHPRALAAIGLWLVIMHVLDFYWLVLPAFDPTGISVSWVDFAALLMVIGFTTAAAAYRTQNTAVIPVHDPYLAKSLQYVEP